MNIDPRIFSARRQVVFFLALAIILPLALAIHNWKHLPDGAMSMWDEYLTLDRSNHVVEKGDLLTVYTGGVPSFKKPPLQYWLTAAAMANISDTEFAVRLPSYLFAIGTLIATGLLAYMAAPSTPVAVPLAVLFMAASDNFWTYALSGMLDTGAAFFGLTAVLTAMMAVSHPKYWYVCAAAVWLGAMQKGPVGLLIVAGMFLVLAATSRFHGIRHKEILANGHFRRALRICIGLMLVWPVILTVQHGYMPFKVGIMVEMLERFSPIGSVPEAHDSGILDWLAGPEKFLWLPAIAAAIIAPFTVRTWQAFVLTGLVALFFILMAMATGRVYARYLLVVLPFMAAILAVVLASLSRHAAFAVAAAAVLLHLNGPLVRDVSPLLVASSPWQSLDPLLDSIRNAAGGGDTILTIEANTGMVSYFAGKGRRVYGIKGPELANGFLQKRDISLPVTGLTPVQSLPLLRETLELEIVMEHAGHVHWVANAMKSR